MSDNLDDLVGERCPRCGREYPGPDYDGEPGFCCTPWLERAGDSDAACAHLYVKRLESQLSAATARAEELERQLADVKTLDDWAERHRRFAPSPDWDGNSWGVHVPWLGEIAGSDRLEGATPDEARAKAAARVRSQRAKESVPVTPPAPGPAPSPGTNT